jgi:hypothetical protein
LWQRGYIKSDDITKSLKDYTIKGRKDQCSRIEVQLSLNHLMSTCTDFEEEEIIQQAMGHLIGIEVDRVPKCHPELAGEGIEYTGACCKNHFCNILLDRKRGGGNF